MSKTYKVDIEVRKTVTYEVKGNDIHEALLNLYSGGFRTDDGSYGAFMNDTDAQEGRITAVIEV